MTAQLNVADKIKSIANNIRKVRESKNYTQEYVAMKLQLSQNAFSKIELGYTKITLERLYQIATLLETDILTFLQDKTPAETAEVSYAGKVTA